MSANHTTEAIHQRNQTERLERLRKDLDLLKSTQVSEVLTPAKRKVFYFGWAAAKYFDEYGQAQGALPDSDVLDEVPEFDEGKTTSAIVKVRVNQERFRRAILASYNARCCISGLAEPRLLIASHIVPWSMDTKNRLNPQNGLCLSALHDKAYDLGLITVLPDLTVRVSRQLMDAESDGFAHDAIAAYNGRRITLPDRFGPNPAFLESHAKRFNYL